MQRIRTNVNVYGITLLLFCIANILELFIPRMDEGNYFVRMPIQVINGILLVLMWGYLLTKRKHWTPVTKSIYFFVILILLYSIIYIVDNDFNIAQFAPYIRLLLWTTSMLFFYEMLLKYGLNRKLMCIYTLTFIAAVAKKISEASLFESETLAGGDTASLPLLLIIPVILLCFNNQLKYLLILSVAILVLFSLRRTVILGFVLCLPFLYRYIRTTLKASHILILAVVSSLVIFYIWSYIGDAVTYRFENLLIGDGGGAKSSYGSGRSDFYKTVWNSWVSGDNWSLFLGNGLTSVERLLMRVENIAHAHNDFLEIAYTFGILGLSIWLIFIFNLLRLWRQLRIYSPENISLFYIVIISYIIIGLASGCILRITTMPFAFSVSLLLYKIHCKKTNILSEEAYDNVFYLNPGKPLYN